MRHATTLLDCTEGGMFAYRRMLNGIRIKHFFQEAKVDFFVIMFFEEVTQIHNV